MSGSDESTDVFVADSARETVRESRDRTEAVVVEDEEYGFACKDTGCSPAPVTDATFEDAKLACLFARTHRRAFRRLDPSLPDYDPGVCDADTGAAEQVSVRKQTCSRRENGLSETGQSAPVSGGDTNECLRVENAPVDHLRGAGSLLDDKFVPRQLEAKLRGRL
jgi:hypothetical protein